MASRLTRLTRLARQSTLLPHLQTQQPIRHASNAPNPNPNPFQSGPSPLRLPPDQQAEFERLQRTANTQEGFNPTSIPDFSSPSPASTDTTTATADTTAASAAETPALADEFGSVPLRKGAPPEFEGDVNPKTGEVGGPKNEPLRWGPGGDYSFNGRVTDF
ncbi:DUF1674-domain-containing protein [Annulohypoxylon truncatum]|uniref:DUF1674-domain-containing protein n=1 Tax=Annulohypoxylon truncatum TaxID=327061 RepID=UPI0020077545|nr:DUF1674-domain-containing protein [Annulohypoxylon truncatum]KAI1204471.1 DUF1674-domain-containing protein [Annulohypoxylon truncatum]